jgi:hypothetical protein
MACPARTGRAFRSNLFAQGSKKDFHYTPSRTIRVPQPKEALADLTTFLKVVKSCTPTTPIPLFEEWPIGRGGFFIRQMPMFAQLMPMFTRLMPMFARLMPMFTRLMPMFAQLMPMFARLMPMFTRLLPMFAP